MEKYTVEDIRNNGLLIYDYLRGSHCHGIARKDSVIVDGVEYPASDEDYGGVFLAPANQLLGLGFDYQDQIASEKNDDTYYELNKFMRLLLKSNPTILEGLFVDDKFVRYEHPIMTAIKEHRDEFLTKKCFDSFYSYGKSQIKKASGLYKLINWDIPERKEILDFVYTFHKQGSSKITNWLEYRGLKQEYCGLVNVANMPTMLGCFYDWGNHFLNEGVGLEDLINAWNNTTEYDTIKIVKQIKEEGREDLKSELKKAQFKNMVKFIVNFYNLDKDKNGKKFLDFFKLKSSIIVNLENWYNKQKPIGYKGMVNHDHTSNELRLSSVEKDELPICHVSYYKDSYSQHCRKWVEYQDWVKHRNPVRYQSNLHKSYDAKNICEAFRLMNCGIEIAKGEGYKVDRTGIDADFLLDIRMHKFEYDELVLKLNERKEEMEIAMANSTIPEDIDINVVNDILLDIRKKQLGLK